jgi:signal transduction histidine kinase
MKLTKQLEAEITDVYEAFWGSLFNADIDLYKQVLDDQYRLIGTTEEEVFFSKKEAVRFLKATGDQLAGNIERRKSAIKIEVVEQLILITDQFDAYVLMDDNWAFYGRVRVSTLLQEKTGGWKIIQQHFSMPDAKAAEGQTIGLEKITKENLELREAVKRRTIELELKNRELEIEKALETVRTVAMGMNKADDMLEVCQTISQQLSQLGVPAIRNVQTAIFYESRGLYMNYEYYAKHDKTFITETSYTNHKIHKAFAAKMLKGKGQFYKTHMKGQQVKDWIDYQKSTNVFIDKYLNKASSLNYYWYSLGPVALGISTYEPLTKENLDLFLRFLKVFELAYRRYLDIEKAQEQAKEAQIEAALERLRARSMAMKATTEMGEIIYHLYGELTKLDARLDRCFIMIVNPVNQGITWWMSGQEGLLAENGFFVPMNQHASHLWYLDCWKQRKKSWHYLLAGKEKRDWDRYGFSQTELARLPDAVKKFMAGVKKINLFGSSDQFGSLVTGSFEPLPEEQQEIINRFATVFDQTYTRFLDLQKAEAQAREAEIELALERVRARTMAMQHSDELQEASFLLDQQVRALGIRTWGCAFNVYREYDSIEWFGNEKGVLPVYTIPRKGIFKKYYEQGQKGNAIYVQEIAGKKCIDHYEYMCTLPVIGEVLKQLKITNGSFPDYQIDHVVYFKYGYLLFITVEQVPEAHDVFIRFAKVFEQTYTRFLDLQKAETQAKEAQIEAALERVRARAMAMHSSKELEQVSLELRKQMSLLGQKDLEVCAIHLYDTNEDYFDSWSAMRPPDSADEIAQGQARFPKKGVRIVDELMSHYAAGTKDYVVVNEKEKIVEWFSLMKEHVPDIYASIMQGSEGIPVHQMKSYWSVADFSGGALVMVTYSFPDEPTRNLLRRTANVFELAYTRFHDLQKAEAQAKEAKIEASLERVRSRTMAMQKSDELAETAAVLFQQLIALGIAPNRLYIILTNEDSSELEAWVTDEDGSKVSMGFTGDYKKNGTLLKMYEGWKQKKKQLVIDMQGEELQQYFHYLYEDLKIPFKGGLEQKRRVQHIAYFSHGLIGMASPEEQPAETLQLLERFAAVFNLTFTRFNDLKIAEAHALQAEQDLIVIKEAKQKAEEALTVLQATQKQLVQSEKMASLGELTAGIAHEIQNPLNFVNNFSEVSKELLDEMREAIEKGDAGEATEIMHDVIQNLEKIAHHGKRADAIVKGMLQHSRTGSGQKEATDINALCDEYLRLAYHGLRAKDSSFNASIETDFDQDIGTVSVLPQDLGRVILNLINNAFYAVAERKKQGEAGYTPTVTVRTKKAGNYIEIIVKDNAMGIPQKVLEKIFQPFFTTKPTGEGTGLGLSLSYDIVTKGHGGELKVETKEGEFTSFVVRLPG